MASEYYSVDAILAEETYVPARLVHGCTGDPRTAARPPCACFAWVGAAATTPCARACSMLWPMAPAALLPQAWVP